ncbi:hypothetical protein D0Y65_035533 [Glycine soja]|uniref:Tf2-1-like SH3-like domain-containing protein n=1 Tax=Glycine soja TaxID=3848 RepID=A0A445HAA2_GLYSO|nr:hypothetical protein D0Y65_035533 [Glycine soja]
MAPYEALYGRRCRTPLCWLEHGEALTLGPEVVQQTTEKVKLIQERMRTAQSRQKSYQDKRRKDLEFERVGPVAYQIALPPSLSNLHNVFHVSQLRKYIHDPSHMVELDDVQVRENLTYETLPLRIEDRRTKHLRGKEIPLVKVIPLSDKGALSAILTEGNCVERPKAALSPTPAERKCAERPEGQLSESCSKIGEELATQLAQASKVASSRSNSLLEEESGRPKWA